MKVVKCMVCGKEFSGIGAGKHKRDTRRKGNEHNEWELLIPKEEK